MKSFIVKRERTSTGYWYKLYNIEGKFPIDDCFDTIYGDGLDDPAPKPFKIKNDWVTANPVEGTVEKYGPEWENAQYEITVMICI